MWYFPDAMIVCDLGFHRYILEAFEDVEHIPIYYNFQDKKIKITYIIIIKSRSQELLLNYTTKEQLETT